MLLSTTLVVSLTSLAAKPGWAAPEDSGSAKSNPIFLTGPNQGTPDKIAIDYLRANPVRYGVAAGDLRDLAVISKYTSKHNGVTHVNLAQRHEGLEIFGAAATVNVARDGSVVFAGDSLVTGLPDASPRTASLDAVEAVEAAADGLDLAEPKNPRVMSRATDAAQRTVVSGSGISDQPIPAKLGWHATEKDGLRLAWQVVIDDSTDAHLWNATVDAETGDLLDSDDWTIHHDADELAGNLNQVAGRSLAGTSASTTLGSHNPVQDGSSYRVYGYPTESPNDGPRSLVTNPADGTASPYGWHDTDGAPGAEHTTTQGNNVHAYQDQDNNNAADFGSSPSGGANLNFDFPLDLNENPQNYRDAATANLFYWNNIIHDVSYLYGFDEASGNFQMNNYGRGGTGGDFVRAEAADGGGTNNANFSTPAADGGTPRMQMYLWPGNQFGAQNQVVVDGVGSFDATWSRYSPAPTSAGLSGQFVYAGNGCATSAYPGSLPSGNWIAVVDGGTAACTYLLRTQVAQSLGAKAVVVAHNATGAAPVLTGTMTTAPVTIPAVAVNQADGAAVKAAITAGTTAGSVRKHPSHPGIRDGDLDAGIVMHEYGHGISLRLTGGPGINCLSGNEQMGEGWSDYFALTTLLDPKLDTADGTRGLVPYVLFEKDRTGNGLRPRPYSRNMELQPFTYDSIKTGGWLNGTSLAAPHGIGHGWTSVLWDMTWDLIDRHGLNPNVYDSWNTGGNNLSLQLVMDGLKMQGCAPGFVTGRNAIIAADAALTGGENACTLWASFARRGLGYSA
ncbi:M36 family metallopeptidase, partial [Micromonospora sp. PLK6-60]|nr:M36 family metallopeptidase [Micromonospora sp. PLK6-60]